MLVQVRLECEGLVAPGADEGLGVGVGLDVSPQVRLVRERLLADVAGERFLS